MKRLCLLVGFLLVGSRAWATGGFDCRYAQDGLSFELGGVTSRSFESAIVSANGTVQGEMGDDGSVFQVGYDFTEADVMQYWNSGNEFRVILYSEKESTTTIDSMRVEIRTTADAVDEWLFRGTISIIYRGQNGNWSISEAPIECSIE